MKIRGKNLIMFIPLQWVVSKINLGSIVKLESELRIYKILEFKKVVCMFGCNEKKDLWEDINHGLE